MRKPCANPELFLTAKELAYMAGVSVSQIYKWLRSDDPPPHVKRGTKYLFPRNPATEWATRDVLE